MAKRRRLRKRKLRSDGKPDEEELMAIVTAIREEIDPERIVLFGSGARGELSAKSDIDLMVVKAGCHRLGTRQRIYEALPVGRSRPVDVLVARPEDIKTYRDAPWSAIYSATREGKEVYARKAAATRA